MLGIPIKVSEKLIENYLQYCAGTVALLTLQLFRTREKTIFQTSSMLRTQHLDCCSSNTVRISFFSSPAQDSLSQQINFLNRTVWGVVGQFKLPTPSLGVLLHG